MSPVLSIGSYLLFLLITLLQVRWCFHRSLIVKHFRPGRSELVVLLVYLLLGVLPVEGAMLPDSEVKFFLQAAGNIWLGFYIYFGGFLLVFWLIIFLTEKILHKKLVHVRLGAFAVSILLGVVLLAYGMIHAQHTVVTHYDVSIDKSAGEMSDLKVVLLGDLHLSVNSVLSTTETMVNMVNEEQPDVVLIAGDIFTSSYDGLKNPEKYAAALRGMQAKYGVYAVYGNHDVEETLFGGFPISPISEAFRSHAMEQFFKECNFTVLYDETSGIADGQVQIVGRVDGQKAGDGTDKRKSPQQVLADVDKNKPVIVLQHEPVEFALLKENGADLALCGHTHDGQMFPGNLIVPFFNENAYGYKVVSGLQTIVTSGVGYYGPPMRVGTNSEIAVINIHFQ